MEWCNNTECNNQVPCLGEYCNDCIGDKKMYPCAIDGCNKVVYTKGEVCSHCDHCSTTGCVETACGKEQLCYSCKKKDGVAIDVTQYMTQQLTLTPAQLINVFEQLIPEGKGVKSLHFDGSVTVTRMVITLYDKDSTN